MPNDLFDSWRNLTWSSICHSCIITWLENFNQVQAQLESVHYFKPRYERHSHVVQAIQGANKPLSEKDGDNHNIYQLSKSILNIATLLKYGQVTEGRQPPLQLPGLLLRRSLRQPQTASNKAHETPQEANREIEVIKKTSALAIVNRASSSI